MNGTKVKDTVLSAMTSFTTSLEVIVCEKVLVLLLPCLTSLISSTLLTPFQFQFQLPNQLVVAKPRVFPKLGNCTPFHANGCGACPCITPWSIVTSTLVTFAGSYSVFTQTSDSGDNVICPSCTTTANGFTFSTPDISLCEIAES